MRETKYYDSAGRGVGVVYNEEHRIWPCVCVDLESLDTRPTARILEIGAVCFDPITQELGPQFLFEVDARSQDFRSIDLDTVLWWEARKAEGIVMPGIERHDGDLWVALRSFADFMKTFTNREEVEVWAWGVDFDCGILKDAWTAPEEECPLSWIYPNQRDARTLCKMLGIKREGKIAHRALPDAIQEAWAVMEAYGKMDVLEGLLRQAGQGVGKSNLEPDYEAGWNAYRQELLETMGMTSLPRWEALTEQVRECFVVGVQAAIKF